MDHDRVAACLRDLVLAAGAEIMAVYRRGDGVVRQKADASPVTEADERADALIRRGLAEAFPDIPAVTEEQAASHTTRAPVFFLVDPLDGTKEFVNRRGDFTVNIALIAHGQPIRGAVFAPALGRLFFTDAAGRPWLADGDGQAAPRPIAVRRPDPDGLIVVASKSHRDAATDAYIARYPVATFTSAGSSLKFCLLAAGEADLYPRLGRTMEWDTAAGHAVLAAAGGRVIRLDDLAPLSYGKPGYENPHFIAHVPGVTPLAG